MNTRNSLPLQLRLKMLGAVLAFMSKSGVSDSEIRESFETCLASFKRGRAASGAESIHDLKIGNENISAALLRLWHRDSRYIDSEAKPKPLPLAKGRNNLHAAIRRIDSHADANEILDEMKAVGLIRKVRSGLYLPTSESAVVSKLHPLATDHIAKLVVRLVSTVSRNVSQSPKSLSLIERHAYTPDLSWSEREAFAEFTRLQGIAYLESVDNWLEQRRVRRAVARQKESTKGVPASVHLFAYLGDGGNEELIRERNSKRRKAPSKIRPSTPTHRATRVTSPRATPA